MNEALSEARKATASAISSGLPSLPRGVSPASLSSVSRPSTCTISVSITPGATQFTRMCDGASYIAKERVRPMMACFVAEYATSQDAPCSPHIEEMFTMQPACSRSMLGSTS